MHVAMTAVTSTVLFFSRSSAFQALLLALMRAICCAEEGGSWAGHPVGNDVRVGARAVILIGVIEVTETVSLLTAFNRIRS